MPPIIQRSCMAMATRTSFIGPIIVIVRLLPIDNYAKPIRCLGWRTDLAA